MKEKQRELLLFLLQQDTVISSTAIAQALGISKRTVKNYIAELNTLAPEMIEATNKGYRVQREAVLQLLEPVPQELPDSFKARALYMIKEVLIKHRSLTIMEIETELFVSESTLRSDLTKMNRTFGSEELRFAIRHETLVIEGEEKEKRRLMSLVIFEEMPRQFIDMAILEKNFCPEDVQKIVRLIRQVTEKTNYYLNDFAFMNLVLHLLILVEAVRNGHVLVARETSSVWLGPEQAQLVNYLIADLEAAFTIHLNASEREEMHVLFQANTNYLPTNDFQKIQAVVGTELLQQVDYIVQKVHENYGINLHSQAFTVSFALHLSGLVARAKEQNFIKNPMLTSIKKDFPIVYAIAVYVALLVGQTYNVTIPEDECGYLALHIGSELEEQRKNQSKIRTVLLCPRYMDLDVKLYQEIEKHFSNTLNIIAVVPQLTEVAALDFDLLISTLDAPFTNHYHTVQLSPIFNEEQKNHLISELATIRSFQKRKILFENFDRYFSESGFWLEPPERERDPLLKVMCQRLQEQEVVPTGFYQHVQEREQAASTAYDAIAIPHSIHTEADKTTIAVALSKAGIKWQDKKVHIVLLTALNEFDRKQFFDIYEAVIDLFDHPETYSQLLKITSFQEFRQLLLKKS